jgi:glycosyltransferase involved in cell wall biosynthesis
VSPPPAERIRVLILIKGLGIGGAETLIAESSRFWNREDFDYRVVYMLPWKDQLVGSLEGGGVTVNSLDWKRPPGMGAVLRLRGLFRDSQPHLVHSHLPAAGVMARLALPDRTHVYTEHNIVDSYRQPTRWLNRVTYSRNRAVIAVSLAVANSVAGYPGPQPIVIPNGVSVSVDANKASRVREEMGVEPDSPLIVHVGNIRPHKGHGTLIEATRLLLKEIPEAVVASLGGEKYQGDLHRVRSEAAEAGIERNLRFMGRRYDARSFLAAADVVVNPADVEGLPVSILEAMALRRPVVATAVGGVPSVVRHEVTGLLVPPGDPEELAAALVRALTSPDAKTWGEEAARLVDRDFGLHRMVAAYEGVYREVLGV